MPENTELEAFLQESTSASVSVPPEPERAASTGESPPPSPTPAPGQDDDDGDDASPASVEEGVQAAVPREALEAERRRRQDWKEKAARAEGELAALRRQLDEARRPQQPQPQPQPVYRAPPPDPNTDPQGYQQYAQQVEMERDINRNLNYSEWLLRDKLGDETVSQLQQEFKQMAEADRSLFEKMYSQPHPYRWMQQQVEKHRAMAEIGDNPAEFRAKIEAEARAKWEAEQGGEAPAAAPVPSRVAGMAPSLANARSSAPRSAPAYTGMSLEQMFPPYAERRKKA